ncbi:MAG: exodeoxyribonuclease VII small subunit [Lacipirellulaceae bacterium]
MAKKIAKKSPPAESGESFEEALGGLERMVAELEGGDLPLARALEAYEAGVARLRACHTELERAERRIELLSGVDAQGNPVVRPFDEGSGESLEASASARGAKRTAAPQGRAGDGVDARGQLF